MPGLVAQMREAIKGWPEKPANHYPREESSPDGFKNIFFL